MQTQAEVHRLSRRCAPALEQQWVRSVGGEVRGIAPNLQLQSVLVLISRMCAPTETSSVKSAFEFALLLPETTASIGVQLAGKDPIRG